MFLVNSRRDTFRCGLELNPRQSLSRSYGRFFAEFLNASCPDRLSLLDYPTSVGLRYGLINPSERRFSWKPKHADSVRLRRSNRSVLSSIGGFASRSQRFVPLTSSQCRRSGVPSPSRLSWVAAILPDRHTCATVSSV